jgi:hypothetical protein
MDADEADDHGDGAGCAHTRQSHGAGGAWQGQALQPSTVAAHSREPAYQARERLMVAQARCMRSSINKKRLVQSVFLIFHNCFLLCRRP